MSAQAAQAATRRKVQPGDTVTVRYKPSGDPWQPMCESGPLVVQSVTPPGVLSAGWLVVHLPESDKADENGMVAYANLPNRFQLVERA